MMKSAHIIQLSDTHIFADEAAEFGGVDTQQSLARVIDQIITQEAPFDAVIVTGDLVQQAVPAAYQRLLSHLERFSVPVYCIAGNHDEPEMLQQCLNTDTDRYVAECLLGGWRIIFLNSHLPGTHAGHLAESELSRLRTALETQDSSPVLICLHHHPVSIGSPWMDAMALQNPQDLFDITDQHAQVRAIVWGHIHQEFASQRKGVYLFGCPSSCAQFQPGATAYARDTLGPGYRRLRLDESGHVSTEIIRLEQG